MAHSMALRTGLARATDVAKNEPLPTGLVRTTDVAQNKSKNGTQPATKQEESEMHPMTPLTPGMVSDSTLASRFLATPDAKSVACLTPGYASSRKSTPTVLSAPSGYASSSKSTPTVSPSSTGKKASKVREEHTTHLELAALLSVPSSYASSSKETPTVSWSGIGNKAFTGRGTSKDKDHLSDKDEISLAQRLLSLYDENELLPLARCLQSLGHLEEFDLD